LTWGVISALTAFVWNEWSFYVIRFLLGIAEAGYYPGIILYLTWWFPSAYRSRMIALFMTAIPVAVITGSWRPDSSLGWMGFGDWPVGNGFSSSKRCRRLSLAWLFISI
jgi:MFS family permease